MQRFFCAGNCASDPAKGPMRSRYDHCSTESQEQNMRPKSRNQHVGFFAAIAVTMAVQTRVLDERPAAMFVRELQRAVARDDRAAVSALIQYPLTVFAGGLRIPIPDTAALLQSYDVIFSPALKSLIARAAIPARGRAADASVVVTAGLVTVGIDAVRIEPVGSGLRITRITVPLAASSPEGGAAAKRSGSHEPQRLTIGVGRIQRAGALAPGQRDMYLLSAMKNQLLEVRINGVSGRDIVARISSVSNRQPLDSRAHDGVRTWIGRVPADGDYRIDVVRLASGGDSLLPYVMVVSMQ